MAMLGIWIYALAWMAAIGGYYEAWTIVFLGTIVLIGVLIHEHRVDNYDISKVSNYRMWDDKTRNHLSDYEVQRNMIIRKVTTIPWLNKSKINVLLL